jgi:hypothetical protein
LEIVDAGHITSHDIRLARLPKQRLGRGLCLLSEDILAVDCTPASSAAQLISRYSPCNSICTKSSILLWVRTLHVHDLRHTVGRRLRALQVPFETRRDVLGHKNGNITTHYSAAEVRELLDAVTLLKVLGTFLQQRNERVLR